MTRLPVLLISSDKTRLIVKRSHCSDFCAPQIADGDFYSPLEAETWGFCLSLSVSSDHDFKLIWAMISSPNKLLLFQWRAEAESKCFFCSFGQHKADIKWFENWEKYIRAINYQRSWGLVCFGNNTVLLVIIQKFFTLKLNQFQV